MFIRPDHEGVIGGVVWCGVVWCGVVWCGVVWCGVVWCGVVWCGVVWCGVVWCGVVWCGVVWCGVVWCGVVWCGVVWCGVVWCGVVWCGVVWCGGWGKLDPSSNLPSGGHAKLRIILQKENGPAGRLLIALFVLLVHLQVCTADLRRFLSCVPQEVVVPI